MQTTRADRILVDDLSCCDTWCHNTKNAFYHFFKYRGLLHIEIYSFEPINELQLNIPESFKLLLHGKKCLSEKDNENTF